MLIAVKQDEVVEIVATLTDDTLSAPLKFEDSVKIKTSPCT
jgi:hypothetical protein